MTSSNGNIFRVTGQLCGEVTGHRWIRRTKASDVFFDLCPNKRLSKQSCGWFETPSRLLWRHCNVDSNSFLALLNHRGQIDDFPLVCQVINSQSIIFWSEFSMTRLKYISLYQNPFHVHVPYVTWPIRSDSIRKSHISAQYVILSFLSSAFQAEGVLSSVCQCVRKLHFVRTITCHRFGSGSPNLHQTCILGYYRLVWEMGFIDLELQGHVGHFYSGV